MASQSVLKELTCPNCGSPIQQFNPSAQTLVCSTCGSHVAIGAGDAEVISEGRARLPEPPVPITIGKMATIDGVEYIVLGRVVYTGWDESETSDRWTWNEWLLGSSDGRLLWLALDEKGFSLYKKLRFREPFNARTDRILKIADKSIRIRENYPARIDGAEGELTWRAERGEQLYVAEGAGGGKRYSVQQTPQELEVHEGTAVEEDELARTFGDEAWLKSIRNRKNSRLTMAAVGAIALIFAVAALVAMLFVGGSGEQFPTQTVSLNTENPIATLPVDLNEAERPARIDIALRTNIPANSYIDVDVIVQSPDETRNYLFLQELWHETGRDEDGTWTERQMTNSDMFVPFQTGEHIVELQFNSPQVNAIELDVTVTRNVIMTNWFLIYAIVLGGLGGFLVFLGMREG